MFGRGTCPNQRDSTHFRRQLNFLHYNLPLTAKMFSELLISGKKNILIATVSYYPRAQVKLIKIWLTHLLQKDKSHKSLPKKMAEGGGLMLAKFL